MAPIVRLCAFLAVAVPFLSGAPALAQTTVQSSTNSPQGAPTVKDPRSRAKIHTELGALYYQEGQMATAMEELTIAIAIDASYAPAYAMRALVHNYLKEPNYADDNFKQALNLTPDDPELANNYGWFLCQNGREKEGIPHFLRALKNPLYQTPDRAYLNAGQCSLKLGDFNAAEDYLEKAHRLSGGSPISTLRLSELYFRRGDNEEARRRMADLLRMVEPNAEALWLAIRIERKLGDRQAEAGFVSQLRRKFPKSKEYEELLKGNYE